VAVSRTYPAIDVSWPSPPDAELIGQLLATLDDERPTAIEDRHDGVRVFFANAHACGRASDSVRRHYPEAAISHVSVSDEAWAERSQAALTPIRVGRLVIAPPWTVAGVQAEPAFADTAVIIIQPSMGFGTGHHASTRLCLQLLQTVSIAGHSFLDVGTGSGVLAIAASRLGALPVVAGDIDVDALTSAAENIELNGLADSIDLRALDITAPGLADGVFDLVTANLTGSMLVCTADSIVRCLRSTGMAIVSGVTIDEEAAVVAAFLRERFTVERRACEQEWVALVFARGEAPA
jgi:ribosomal protein L11 methyltransferase